MIAARMVSTSTMIPKSHECFPFLVLSEASTSSKYRNDVCCDHV